MNATAVCDECGAPWKGSHKCPPTPPAARRETMRDIKPRRITREFLDRFPALEVDSVGGVRIAR